MDQRVGRSRRISLQEDNLKQLRASRQTASARYDSRTAPAIVPSKSLGSEADWNRGRAHTALRAASLATCGPHKDTRRPTPNTHTDGMRNFKFQTLSTYRTVTFQALHRRR